LQQVDIEGGTTIEESAIFTTIISGKGTEAQNNVVCANAGMAIATVNGGSPIEGFELAYESLLRRIKSTANNASVEQIKNN
jgi:anthranilate phosphoribosyltransferase